MDEDVEEDIINDDIEETIQDLGIEQRAGICEFMDSNIKGFFGVIKQRFYLFLYFKLFILKKYYLFQDSLIFMLMK